MDSESQLSSRNSRPADDADSSVHYSGELEVLQCAVCRRAISLDNEVRDAFEAPWICGECKVMVLDVNEASVTTRDYHPRRRRRGRSRYRSSESTDDLFSQQFSQLINLVRQNQEGQSDGDTAIMAHQHASYSPAQVRVRRWQRTISDNETESLYQTDSAFGETDSNISFGGFGESDASLDGHSLLDREMVVQVDNESHVYTDTDIDPMNAGLDRWDSDEEDGEWEEADIDEAIGFAESQGQIHYVDNSPMENHEMETQGRAWIRWRMGDNQNVRYADIYNGLEESEVISPYVGNPGDYLDARGFEELLEQLAETGSSRRGAPPAAASIVIKLPDVVISHDHERHGSLVCPVCKDPLLIDTEAKQLPCMHLYHPSCILPWLSARNSCPVCRYELPTDDLEYEEGKKNTNRNEVDETAHYDPAGGSSSNTSSDDEADEIQESGVEIIDQVNAGGTDSSRAHGSNGEGGARRWIFLAAAPVVSIVGIALVLWFRNSTGDRRMLCNTRERDRQPVRTSHGSSTSSTGRNRRWWSLL